MAILPCSDPRKQVVCYWQKYGHVVLVCDTGGPSLPCNRVNKLDWHDMTLVDMEQKIPWEKKYLGVCSQWKLRLSCISTQSDQSLHCLAFMNAKLHVSEGQKVKDLIRLGKCIAWSVITGPMPNNLFNIQLETGQWRPMLIMSPDFLISLIFLESVSNHYCSL